MRFLGFWFLLGAVLSASAPPARALGVRVLRSDASAVEVEWTGPQRPEWESVPGERQNFRRPRLAGALYLAAPGEPDVPSLVRLVGLPLDQEPTVRVLSVESSSVPIRDMAPAGEPRVHSREGKDPLGLETRTAPPAGPGVFPDRWAGVDATFWMRGQRMGRLVLHPCRYDPSSGELLYATRMVVRVELRGEASTRRAHVSDGAAWEAQLDRHVLNADVARSWRRPRPAQRSAAQDSFSSAPTWLSFPVTKAGIYRLDYFTLANAGVDPAGVDPRTLRVFSGTNLPLNTSYATPPPDFMTECSLLALDDDPSPDGIFDVDDRFLFWALGPHGWASEYDATGSRTDYLENPYTDSTSYWITWGGSFSAPPRRMDVPRDVTPQVSQAQLAPSTPHRVHYEENRAEDFSHRDEDGWHWESLRGRGRDRLYPLSLDRVAPSRAGVVTVRLLSEGSVTDVRGRDVALKVGGVSVADSVWQHASQRAIVDLSGCSQGLLRDGTNDIRVDVNTDADDKSDHLFTAWFDIEYDRNLAADRGSFLRFFSTTVPSPGADSSCALASGYGKTDFFLQGFRTTDPVKDVFLFDVTDQHDVVRLTGFSTTVAGRSSSVGFSDPAQPGPTRWYVAATMEGVLPVSDSRIVNVRGLRSPANAADYVVVHHENFRRGAERLTSIRRNAPGRQRRTMAVDVRDVYREFSWGMTDPVAVRDFLAFALRTWTVTPLDAVLVGDAAYDTKGYLSGSPPNYLGTFAGRYREGPLQYSGNENIRFYSTDDFFGYLESQDYAGGSQPTLDVAIGRYPCATEEDLEIGLDKLESYVFYRSPGQWQNRALMAADDERSPSPTIREPIHTRQVEIVAESYLPPPIDRVKVYLTEYPRNEFSKKPDAQAEFIEEFTRGALMVSYTGHGDQNTMAQEEVFVSQKTPSLLNEERYCLFSTFSCTISRFDLLSGKSLGELLLWHPDGGPVSTFSSGGLVFPAPSHELNKEWLAALFGTPYPLPTYSRAVTPMGEAVMWGKAITGQQTSLRENNEKYVLLGDSALELRYGGHPVEFEAGTVDSQITEGLLRVVRGAVLDDQGRVLDGSGTAGTFQGTAYVHVTEQADTSGYDYTDFLGNPFHIDYKLDGPTTFRGEVPVEDGRFSARFFLSEAIQSGNRARISVFALEEGSARAASGVAESLFIAPTITAAQVEDGRGPFVNISFEGYEGFVDGDLIFTDRPVLLVDLEDESGVNLRPFPEFALLAAEIDGRERIDLADDFTYLRGSFTQGRVRRILPLTGGTHTLEVKAFDNVGNRGSSAVTLTVVLPGDDFQIVDRYVAVYPSPFHGEADFFFRLTHDADVDLKVFTVSGRKIWGTGPFPAVRAENRVRWDGRDANGRPVANGTYLYKVEASYTDTDGQVQSDEHVGHVVRMR